MLAVNDPIYLDFNATTPPASEVVRAMEDALREGWGNPSSSHPIGRRAREILDRARAEVASLLGAGDDEIVFTSGGTESDHAAILATTEALRDRGRHVVISAIEHPAIEEACRTFETHGGTVTRVGVGCEGRVDPDAVESAFRPDTVLVSVMHANNETGVIQPLDEIARRARRRGILVHTDAAQSVGKIPVSVEALGVDLLTVAGHKLYAPKGIGALYVRRGTPIAPWIRGGGQERGLRGGTEPTPAIAGLGTACALALAEGAHRTAHLAEMRDRLERRLRDRLSSLVVHGEGTPRLPNTLSAAIPGVRARALLDALDGIAASAGAACHSGDDRPSKVLLAMGVSPDLARATLRFSTGRATTPEEIDEAARRIVAAS
jgi:cysteine desulfurase